MNYLKYIVLTILFSSFIFGIDLKHTKELPDIVPVSWLKDNIDNKRLIILDIREYAEYQKGKYLVARNPKSSLENEMFECVIKHSSGKEIMYRQIAGAVARRIISYPEKGKEVQQSDESGIILFGSRLDVLLPIDAIIKLKIGQKVKGASSVIAEI